MPNLAFSAAHLVAYAYNQVVALVRLVGSPRDRDGRNFSLFLEINSHPVGCLAVRMEAVLNRVLAVQWEQAIDSPVCVVAVGAPRVPD